MLLETDYLEATRTVSGHLVGHSVVQSEIEVGAALVEGHRTVNGVGCTVSARVAEIVDGDVAQLAGGGLDLDGLEVVLSPAFLGHGGDGVHYLLFEVEGRPLAADVHE